MVTDSDGVTPLIDAAMFGYYEIVEILVAAGADVNATTYRNDTAAHFAAAWGYSDTLEVLAGFGADMEARGDQGSTPLHVTAIMGMREEAR